jgi:hypothetical protein
MQMEAWATMWTTPSKEVRITYRDWFLGAVYRQSVIIPVYIETFLGLSDAYSVQQHELWHVPRQHVGASSVVMTSLSFRIIFCSVLLAPSTPQPLPTPPSTAVCY